MLLISYWMKVSTRKINTCLKQFTGKSVGIFPAFSVQNDYYMLFYTPSFGIASCVGTLVTVTCHLHLTWPWCVALERVLIWGLSPALFGSNKLFSTPYNMDTFNYKLQFLVVHLIFQKVGDN